MQTPYISEHAARILEAWDWTHESYREMMDATEVLEEGVWGFDGYVVKEATATNSDSFEDLIEWALEDIRRDGRIFAVRAADWGTDGRTVRDARYYTLCDVERRLSALGLHTTRETLVLDQGTRRTHRRRAATVLVSPFPIENARTALYRASRRFDRAEDSIPLFMVYSEPREPATEPEPEPVTVRYLKPGERAYGPTASDRPSTLAERFPSLYGRSRTV